MVFVYYTSFWKSTGTVISLIFFVSWVSAYGIPGTCIVSYISLVICMPSRWSATCPPGGDLGKKSGVRGMKCPQNWGSTGCGAEVIQKKAWHSYFLLSILPSVFFEMQVPEMKLSTMWWDSWYFHPVGHMVWFFQVQFVSAPGFPILYEEDWHWNDTDLNSRESAKLIEKLIPRFDKKITFPTLFVVLEAVSTSVNIYQKTLT